VVSRRRARTGQEGLTIVELLVTMAIASMIASSTFIFFVGQQRVYDTQSKLLNVQQNLWAALETLSRHVRASGTGMVGCVRGDPDGDGPDLGDPPPGGPAPPQTGLRAFRADLGVVRIAPLWIRNGTAGGPDTLTVAFGSGAFGTYSDASLGAAVAQATDAVTTLAGETAGFRRDEFMILLDGGVTPGRIDGDRGCSLMQITGILGATNTLVHAPTSLWNPAANEANLVPFGYAAAPAGTGAVRNFGQLTWVQFAIDDTGAPAVPPRLTMDRLDDAAGPQILAEGIEDLQIAYACDTLPAGAPDGAFTEGSDPAGRQADEWTYNEPGDVEPATCQRPTAVRITVIARSLTPDGSLVGAAANAKPAAEDGVAGAPDEFRHRAMTATVYPRN
jgi:prepilin-type N-terminal cleavage/methylation domain-containing protein